MKGFIKKLSGKKGASMILALLIVLISTFAGAGVITMAATNMGRYAHDTDDQQAYYSVTSAAILIRDTLAKAQYTSQNAEYKYESKWEYTAAGGEYGDNEKGEHKLTEDYTLKFNGSGSFELTGDNVFGAKIVSHMDNVFQSRSIPDEWYNNANATLAEGEQKKLDKPQVSTANFSFTITSDKISIGTVNATLIIYDNYDLLFSFLFQAGNSKLYSVSLYMESEVNDVTKTDVKSDPTSSSASETNTTTKHVEVKWPADKATISRGEAIPEKQDTPSTGTGE